MNSVGTAKTPGHEQDMNSNKRLKLKDSNTPTSNNNSSSSSNKTAMELFSSQDLQRGTIQSAANGEYSTVGLHTSFSWKGVRIG
jgi:hypothetical protein